MSLNSLTRRRAAHTPETPTQRISGIVTMLALAVLVAVPLAVIVLAAFRTEAPGFPSEFTLANFSAVFDSAALELLKNSLIISVGTTVLALVIGGTLAVVLLRTNVLAGKRLDSLIMVPAYMSPFIGAIAWTLLFSPDIGYGTALFRSLGLPIFNVYSFAGIIVVMGVYYAPIAYLYIRAMLGNIDASLEESARVLGASSRVTMRVVVLPLALPAILSASLLVLVAALGQFGVPGVLGLRVGIDVIPTRIVQLTTNYPSSPTTAAALGVELAVFALIVLWINNLVLNRRDYTTIATRGGTGRSKGRRNILGTAFAWLYVALAVVLPIGALVLTSFMPYVTTDIGSVALTLDNYFYVLQEYPSAVRATRNSVLLALAAAVVATAMAMMLAFIRYRTQSRFRKPLDYLSTLPVAIPHSVVGLAFLWAWLLIPTIVPLPFPVYGTGLILLMLYVALFIPYAARAANSALLQVDKSLEESARVLGASWPVMVRRISLPLLRPGLLTAAVVVFYHAVRELPASMLVVSPGNEVIATAIWDMYTEGLWVKLFALANVNLVIVFAAVWIMRRFGGSEG
jgi:iron(III) transport system permease protein